MATDLHQLIQNLADKASRLGQRNEQLAKDRDKALNRIRDLEYDNAQMIKQIGTLQQQLQHLTVVSTLQATSADKDKTRAILADLIREIDQCINDLTD